MCSSISLSTYPTTSTGRFLTTCFGNAGLVGSIWRSSIDARDHRRGATLPLVPAALAWLPATMSYAAGNHDDIVAWIDTLNFSFNKKSSLDWELYYSRN